MVGFQPAYVGFDSHHDHHPYNIEMNKDKRKGQVLGSASFSTANYRMQRQLLFHLLKKHGENVCFRCGGRIETYTDMTIDHKKPWLEDSSLFWDMENIAFSHSACNSIAHQYVPWKHGYSGYAGGTSRKGCRCAICRKGNAEHVARWRKNHALKAVPSPV